MSNAEAIAQLLVQYRKAADRTDDLSDTANQNQAADQIHECYKRLRETDDGKAGIISLMSDPSAHVRAWAAAHSLQWVPDQARGVLESLCEDNVFPYSFDAKMTLEEFENGRLMFDY